MVHVLTVLITRKKTQPMIQSVFEDHALRDKNLKKMRTVPIVWITKQLTPQLTTRFALDLNVLTMRN